MKFCSMLFHIFTTYPFLNKPAMPRMLNKCRVCQLQEFSILTLFNWKKYKIYYDYSSPSPTPPELLSPPHQPNVKPFLFLFRKQMNREAKKKSNEPK